jgi:hypothetical protein
MDDQTLKELQNESRHMDEPELLAFRRRHHAYFRPALFLIPAVSFGILIALLWFYAPKSPPADKAVAAAEDEVYEAVVRDMLTPSHGQSSLNQLVFEDIVLHGDLRGTDAEACKERVRNEVHLARNAPPPPYDTLADKLYRLFTVGSYDVFPRAETIQDFVQKSCTQRLLSTTFHTDFPRVFIDGNSVFFDIVPTNGSPVKDFHQMFPEAAGIISLSRVGFDSRLHEAIVSTSYVCGGLCGSGRLYILKKKRNKWQVVGNAIIWVS